MHCHYYLTSSAHVKTAGSLARHSAQKAVARQQANTTVHWRRRASCFTITAPRCLMMRAAGNIRTPRPFTITVSTDTVTLKVSDGEPMYKGKAICYCDNCFRIHGLLSLVYKKPQPSALKIRRRQLPSSEKITAAFAATASVLLFQLEGMKVNPSTSTPNACWYMQ